MLETTDNLKRPKAKALGKTKDLPKPNPYAQMLLTTFSHRAFDEDRVSHLKGRWREEVFKKNQKIRKSDNKNDEEAIALYPIDLEIGTGNGYHFAHLASTQLDRGVIGIEVKYKPLIQAIRRALKFGAKSNAFMIRYDAALVSEIFDTEELDNVYIHHPDPWPKEKQWKHRLIQDGFLKDLHKTMKKESFVEFKTDDESYYDWALEVFKESDFEIQFHTRDLHASEKAKTNFITHFENIFLKKGQPIFYLKAFKV